MMMIHVATKYCYVFTIATIFIIINTINNNRINTNDITNVNDKKVFITVTVRQAKSNCGVLCP